MNIQDTEKRLREYVSGQIEALSKSNPSIGFLRPLLSRALDKKLSQIGGMLELIADESGNIDVAGILSEMAESVMASEPFTTNVPMLGEVEIGGGAVKIPLPFIDRKIVMNSADIASFKNFMSSK